jgi:hypothetical protein
MNTYIFRNVFLTPTHHFPSVYNESLDGKVIADYLNQYYGYDPVNKEYKGQLGYITGSSPYLPVTFKEDLSFSAVSIYEKDAENPNVINFGGPGNRKHVIEYVLQDFLTGIPETRIYFIVQVGGVTCFKEKAFENYPGRQDIIIRLWELL